MHLLAASYPSHALVKLSVTATKGKTTTSEGTRVIGAQAGDDMEARDYRGESKVRGEANARSEVSTLRSLA